MAGRTGAADGARVAHAAAGDRRAWAELVRDYDGLVRAVVRGYRMQPADAADAGQNTWLRACTRIGTLRDPASFGGWLARIAHRECLAVLRRGRREQPTETVPDAGDGSPEEVVGHAETVRLVATAVAALPERRRQLLEQLFADDEPTYAAVSRGTGMPVGSIGPTRARALHDLRLRLAAAGVDAAA